MKLIDKLVLKDILPWLLIGIVLFSSLYFAGSTLLQVGRYIALGVPPLIVAKLVGWSITPIIALTFPMGMLLAVLLGFGRMSADSEAVALFAGGIPFLRIAAPAVMLGLIVSLVGYVFNDHVASYANQQIAVIKEGHSQELGETTKAFNFEVHTNNTLIATVHVEKGYDVRARSMRQVTIIAYDAQGEKPVALFYADRAQWKGGKVWVLQNGFFNYTGQHMISGSFDTMDTAETRKLLATTPDNAAFLQRDPDTLNFHSLRRQIAELKKNNGSSDPDVRNAEVSLWFKIALPFACLVFAMVGAPLGLQPQRTSKLTGVVLALPIIFVYWILYTVMSTIARGGHCSPALAAFLPDIIGILAGAALIWKAST